MRKKGKGFKRRTFLRFAVTTPIAVAASGGLFAWLAKKLMVRRKPFSLKEKKERASEFIKEFKKQQQRPAKIKSNWHEFFLEHAMVYGGRTEAETRAALQIYNRRVEEFCALKRKASVRTVINEILRTQGKYNKEKQLITDVLLEKTGNCEARAHYIYSMLHSVFREEIARKQMQVGIQMLKQKVTETGYERHVRVLVKMQGKEFVAEGTELSPLLVGDIAGTVISYNPCFFQESLVRGLIRNKVIRAEEAGGIKLTKHKIAAGKYAKEEEKMKAVARKPGIFAYPEAERIFGMERMGVLEEESRMTLVLHAKKKRKLTMKETIERLLEEGKRTKLLILRDIKTNGELPDADYSRFKQMEILDSNIADLRKLRGQRYSQIILSGTLVKNLDFLKYVRPLTEPGKSTALQVSIWRTRIKDFNALAEINYPLKLYMSSENQKRLRKDGKLFRKILKNPNIRIGGPLW